MDKILIVHASFGEGHKRAAAALEKYFHAPSFDLLDFSSKTVKNFFSYGYAVVTQKTPSFWRLIFYGTKNNRVQKGVEKINRLLASKFLTYLKKVKPQVIVTTHFFPLYFISAAKEEMPIKVITIVTDLKAHPLWVNSCVDYYFVATEETKKSLVRQGVSAEKIFSGYVPIRDGFFRKLTESHLRKKFSLDTKPCLLFMSSLRGRLPLLKRTLRALKEEFNIFIIYGKNKLLKKYLSFLRYPSVRIFTSYDQIWELFHLSSVIITKPGGLTIFEGLYKKKPFIFNSFIPGQEKDNMDLLVKYGIGKFVKSRKGLIRAIYYFRNREHALSKSYPLRVRDIRPALKSLIQSLTTESAN